MLRPATIDSVLRATPRSVVLRLHVDPMPAFAAGQAVLVGERGSGIRRPYSIAVGPHEAARSRMLELLVGVGADGTPGAHLPSLAIGAPLEVEGPVGTFVYPETVGQSAVLFVAGGTGIAPLRAMLHEALDDFTHERRPGVTPGPRVLYSARSAEEFAFDDELSELARGGRLLYRKTVTRQAGPQWLGQRGRISRAHLEALVERPEDTLCFVCGPAALVHEVPRMLTRLGVLPAHIRVEEWIAPAAMAP
jgi:NAD(P)H-flavin reductase